MDYFFVLSGSTIQYKISPKWLKRACKLTNTLHIIPWLGDRVVNTITVLLRSYGLLANCFGGIIDVTNCSMEKYLEVVKIILNTERPSAAMLAKEVPDILIEKHDLWLPRGILEIGYGAKYFDVNSAYEWLSENINVS